MVVWNTHVCHFIHIVFAFTKTWVFHSTMLLVDNYCFGYCLVCCLEQAR
jgi:hypothetical protein